MKAKPPTPKAFSCLILAAFIFFSFSSCRTGPAKTKTGEAGLIFAERNDGAYLAAIENPGKYEFLEVTVPGTFNGKTVIGCDIGTDYKKRLPQMLTREGMERIIDMFAETINAEAEHIDGAVQIDWRDYFSADLPISQRAQSVLNSNNLEWFYLSTFLACYGYISLSRQGLHPEDVLKNLPQCETLDIYMLNSSTDWEFFNIFNLLKHYAPSYSFKDKVNDEKAAEYYRWLVYESEYKKKGGNLGKDSAEKLWKEIVKAGRSAEIPEDPGVITSLSLPDCVEKLTGHLNVGTDLTAFSIPAGVKSIEWDFFIGCRKDMKVTYQGTENWVAVDKNGNKYTFGQLCDSLKNELKLSYGESYKLELKIE